VRTLYLLRHALTGAADPAIPDFERPLSPQGMATARLVGRTMRARGWQPAAVLCSAALRAIATWEAVAAELAAAVQPTVQRGLYLAPPGRLLATVRRLPADAESALLIGHNPGLHGLARMLSGPVDMRRLQEGYPAAALAVLVFDGGTWAALGRGRLEHFLRPHDLS